MHGPVSWLVYRINTPALRLLFMAPRNMFRMRDGLVSLLAGAPKGTWGQLVPVLAFKTIYYVTAGLAADRAASAGAGHATRAGAGRGRVTAATGNLVAGTAPRVVGIDFGTTNSVVALLGPDGQVYHAPLRDR